MAVDNDRITALEAIVTELQARLDHDETSRQELLAATDQIVPTLAKRQQQLETGMATAVTALRDAPGKDQKREQGLLQKFNALLLRQQEVERQFAELREFAVHLSENQQRMSDVLESLRGLLRDLRGGPEAA